MSASAYERMFGGRVESELPAEELFVMEELRKNPKANENVLRQQFRLRPGTAENPAKFSGKRKVIMGPSASTWG